MCCYGDQVKGNKTGGVLTCVGEKVEFYFAVDLKERASVAEPRLDWNVITMAAVCCGCTGLATVM